MFRRRRQFGRRYKRYRTPFTGSSYLYAAEMDFRGRCTTLAVGPVAVGEVASLPIEWVISDNPNPIVENSLVPLTYSMISKILCSQGAPRAMGIAGWATGFIQRVKINYDDYLEQWCTEFATRIYPSVFNTIKNRGLTKLVGGYGEDFLGRLNTLAGAINQTREMGRDDRMEAVRRIWDLCRPMTMETAGDAEVYMHIPFTYLAKSKPPRAAQSQGVFSFAKSQLIHKMSDKAMEKGVNKYGVRTGESLLVENSFRMPIEEPVVLENPMARW